MHKDVLVRNLAARDLKAVAAIHLAAFPQSALTMLGFEPVRRYYEWQLLGPHEVVALGAIVKDELAGFCFGGVFRGATSGFLSKNQKFLFWHVLTHPWLITNPMFRERLGFGVRVLKRYGKKASSSPQHQRKIVEKSFGILSIAVHPRCQGLGVGNLLMKRSEDAAREHGFQEMNLTVHTDNHQAIGFYESLQWERFAKNGVWDGIMRKPLSF